MAIYIIAYDLHRKPPEAYDRLIHALRNAKAWHAQKSMWLLDSPYSAQQNFDWFNQFLHAGDQLMITEITMNNTWVTQQSTTHACFQWIQRVTELKRLAGYQ